jgi:fibronectin-binding autotransporter adhesin
VRFDAIGASHPLIDIVESVSPGSVTVDSASSYSFTGVGQIGGTTGLTKTNSGTLTISTTNSYTGPTTIGGGVLEATLLADAAVNSSIGSSDSLVFTGGTLKYPGDTVSINRGATFNGNGAIEVSNSATALTISGTLAGPGALTKTGPGTLVLTVGNSYSGGTIVSDGTLRINSPGGAGTGGITNNGTTLLVGSAITLANVVHFNGTCTVDLDNVAGNIALDGAWAGSGTVNVINQQDSTRVFTVGGASGGNMTNFTGRINMGTCPGTLRFNDGGGDGSGPNFGSAAATFDLGTSTAIFLARNGGTFNDLGALIGGPSTILRGNANNSGIVTYSIGGNNASTLFEGTIINGSSPTAIVKTGTGKLTLTGNSTYSATTTVSNGTLQVDGSLGFTTVTVEGGTLSGIGTIGGPVTVNSGGTLAPGNSVGTLTLSSDLTIAGNLAIDVDKSLSPSNDVVTVSGALSASSGTITVQNLGPALQLGDTFVLFNQPVGGGSALTVTGAGATWNNNLELDGSISVASVGPAQPKIATITSSGGSVIINGSNGPTTGNYIVLTTTNVAAAVGTWTPILTNPFNGDGTFSVTNAIVPGTPRLFYLIQVQ